MTWLISFFSFLERQKDELKNSSEIINEIEAGKVLFFGGFNFTRSKLVVLIL